MKGSVFLKTHVFLIFLHLSKCTPVKSNVEPQNERSQRFLLYNSYINIYSMVHYMQASTLDFHGNLGWLVTEKIPSWSVVQLVHQAMQRSQAASSLWVRWKNQPLKWRLFGDGLLLGKPKKKHTYIYISIIIPATPIPIHSLRLAPLRYANHGAGICTRTFARIKSPSFVGKYTSTMEHLGYWVNWQKQQAYIIYI